MAFVPAYAARGLTVRLRIELQLAYKAKVEYNTAFA